MTGKGGAADAPERRAGEPASPLRPRPRRLDRALDLAEALLWVSLLGVGSLVALTVLREDPARRQRATLPAPEVSVEAEDMRVVARSGAFNWWLQPTKDFLAGRWSKDGQMFALGAGKGDWIELELPNRDPGPYRLELLLTRSVDYGIVSVSFNGVKVGEAVDLWSAGGVVPSGPLDFGRVELRGRGDVLRLEVAGANPGTRAPHFQFGIDGVRLTKE